MPCKAFLQPREQHHCSLHVLPSQQNTRKEDPRGKTPLLTHGSCSMETLTALLLLLYHPRITSLIQTAPTQTLDSFNMV